MKFKKLLPVAILTISAIAMTAGISQAELSNGEGFSGRSANAQTKKFRKFEALKLTEEQKSQIQEIRKNYRSKIGDILTSEQKAALESAKRQGQNRRRAMQNLNLSSEQKQKLQELKKSKRQEIAGILTAEQKQKLQEIGQQRRSRRGRRGGHAS